MSISAFDSLPAGYDETTPGLESSSSIGALLTRHQLVDAQVELLRMYMEKRAGNQFLAALDRLIECTKSSFREEEQLMELLASSPSPEHRDAHNEVLAELMLLRRCVADSDTSRLLAQLIVIDRQLTTHLSDALSHH